MQHTTWHLISLLTRTRNTASYIYRPLAFSPTGGPAVRHRNNNPNHLWYQVEGNAVAVALNVVEKRLMGWVKGMIY